MPDRARALSRIRHSQPMNRAAHTSVRMLPAELTRWYESSRAFSGRCRPSPWSGGPEAGSPATASRMSHTARSAYAAPASPRPATARRAEPRAERTAGRTVFSLTESPFGTIGSPPHRHEPADRFTRMFAEVRRRKRGARRARVGKQGASAGPSGEKGRPGRPWRGKGGNWAHGGQVKRRGAAAPRKGGERARQALRQQEGQETRPAGPKTRS